MCVLPLPQLWFAPTGPCFLVFTYIASFPRLNEAALKHCYTTGKTRSQSFCSFCYAFLNCKHCSKWGTTSEAWLRYTHARNAERLLAIPAILAMVSAMSEESIYLYYFAFYWYCKTLRPRTTWGGKVLSVYNLSWREEVKSRTQGKNWSTRYQCRGARF